jgi:hypothetical protein
LTVSTAMAGGLVEQSAALAASPEPVAAARLQLRPDLREVGLLTKAHLEAGRTLVRSPEPVLAQPDPAAPPVGLDQVVGGLFKAATTQRGAVGFLLNRGAGSGVDVHALDVGAGGTLTVRTAPGLSNVPIAQLDPRLAATLPATDLLNRLPQATFAPLRTGTGGAVLEPNIKVDIRPGIDDHGVVVVRPDGGQPPETGPPTVTVGPLLTDAAAITRFEQAVTALADQTALAVVEPAQQLVSFDLRTAAQLLTARCAPRDQHAARLDTMIRFADTPAGILAAGQVTRPGWLVAPAVDRVMAFPTLDAAAYVYLAAYDRTRFCPGVDEVPPESVTLLETNPRFIAAFMAGLNHETNRELLWRGYPTDQEGTPFRKFWERLDGRRDIPPIHQWSAGTLAQQTNDPKGSLVLLLRGQLLRRYPNTIVLAIRATGPRVPSDNPADLLHPVFAGHFDPDVSFFGFSLTDIDLQQGEGWFFAIMEPVTEPRFGFDETIDATRAGPSVAWNDVAWPDLASVVPGEHLPWSALNDLAVSRSLTPSVQEADQVAAALFQRPFQLLVHARHLIAPEEPPHA